MVEKKENEKKVVKIKAKTGAWWKSTTVVAEETVEKPVVPKQEKIPQAAPETPIAAKSLPRKKNPVIRPRQKTIEETVEKTDESSSVESKEASSSSKKPIKRVTPRRKLSAAKTPQDEHSKPELIVEVADIVADEPQQAPVAEDCAGNKIESSALSDAETAVPLDSSVPEKKKRGGRRKSPPKVQEVKDDIGHKSDEVDTGAEKASKQSENTAEIAAVAEQTEKITESIAPEVAQAKDDPLKICKLLINAEEPEECRLALLEDGRLESINVSTSNKAQRKNNIYKAKIVAIEPSLQAAFVDYGTEKNGFLPFSEIHPEYYKQDLSEANRRLVENQQWKKLSIIDVVEKGQEILAQVVKEEIGKKGANMTTYLSLPGRCVVLMPGSDSSGISRKISGGEKRTELRDIMQSIEMPEGIGWIVRTASVDINQETLSRDVDYLLKLWGDIKKRGQELSGVGLVYEEQQSVLRFLREHFDPSIEEILVDDKTALSQVKAFVEMLPEQHKKNVKVRLHRGARPIFNQYSVEDQIESIYQPQVSLPSGGSIVIDPTEALVAIDVNSGSTSKGKNFEASIFLANMEAAEELARQLRLRDLGGLIVVDFIDMRSKKNIMSVEKTLKKAMKKDKAKVDFSRISKFGLMEISRQKLGAPIEAGNYRRCEHCKGRGTVRSVETLALYYMRRIQTGATRKPVERVECHFPLDVASYLLNNKRHEIHELEQRYEVLITIVAETSMKPADHELIFHKAEKQQVAKKQA